MLKYAFLLTLLCSGAFGAFIQSPIPPNSKQNYFRDADGDGRMDLVSLRFLGVISQEYLTTMIDSLVFDWLDSSGVKSRYVVRSAQMSLDPSNNRQVLVDLKAKQERFMPLTARDRKDYAGMNFGNATLYVADSIEYPLNIRDGMAPTISNAHLKSYRGKAPDTLTLNFTESVQLDEGCVSHFEFKGTKDSTVRLLSVNSMVWGHWKDQVTLQLPGDLTEKERLSTRDSIRFVGGCARDSLRNATTSQAKFFPVTGFYPFDVQFPVMAVEHGDENENAPVFQLVFESAEDSLRDSVWQVSMEVMGAEFENALREALGMDEKVFIDPSKVQFHCSVKIYTNLGSYVVGTKMDVKGDDPRFKYSPTRLGLRWNLMDGNRRRVATGAYLANIIVAVEYDGNIVFRTDRNLGAATRVFGVMRR